ncbi:hypothetical protein ACH5RR_009565 [Cinchona calisaya]|uniref:Uncharacterized protein n=1 Tax=Cinchona calisaya TaxID=153742 RepID=A0ABD3AGJ2_9GENT
MALAFIDKALLHIEFLLNYFVESNETLQMGLKHLRAFLLCARKWHNHILSESDENVRTRMGSILCRLQDALVEDFDNLSLRRPYTYRSSNMSTRAFDFEECVYSFRQEIMEYYITLSDYSCSLQSDRSAEFIDSLLVNLVDIREDLFCGGQDPVQALREKMVFVKNFIRFAELQGFEPWKLQILYTRLDVVAVNAAILCHEWFCSNFLYSYSESSDKFQLKFSEMLQKIKGFDPQI